MTKRIGILLLSAVIGAFCIEPVGRLLPASMNGFATTVEAIIGRPLTPMSISGVARRTARRCAAGVYC
jgi:hypothetical protein